MKINEVEAAVGVTKKNIRFYEEEGLITPGREPGNGYRSYSQTDVERLRRIKLLRKLDEPPPQGSGGSHRLLHAAPAGARQPGTTGCGADACAPDRTGRTGSDLCEH